MKGVQGAVGQAHLQAMPTRHDSSVMVVCGTGRSIARPIAKQDLGNTGEYYARLQELRHPLTVQAFCRRQPACGGWWQHSCPQGSQPGLAGRPPGWQPPERGLMCPESKPRRHPPSQKSWLQRSRPANEQDESCTDLGQLSCRQCYDRWLRA